MFVAGWWVAWHRKNSTQDWITGNVFGSSDYKHYLILQIKALVKSHRTATVISLTAISFHVNRALCSSLYSVMEISSNIYSILQYITVDTNVLDLAKKKGTSNVCESHLYATFSRDKTVKIWQNLIPKPVYVIDARSTLSLQYIFYQLSHIIAISLHHVTRP